MVDFVFSSQSKDYRENLELAFVDSKRQRYFRFINMNAIPVNRLEKIMKQEDIIREGMKRSKGTYLDMWLETAKQTIEKSKAIKNDMSLLIHSLEQRSKLFDEDLLLELLALTYIREDENPNVFSEKMHDEKIKQFKSDLSQKAGGLYDFFQQAGLKDYLPSDVGIATDYEAFMKQQTEKIAKLTQEIQRTSHLLAGLN